MSTKIGVILLDHGEPPEYNEYTYNSFRNFAHSLIMMGMIPKVVLKAKRGTILMDRKNIFAKEPQTNPELIDAWLRPHNVPAEFIQARKKIFKLIPAPREAHYLLKNAGSGSNEPDFYQFYGFEIYRRWLLMNNHSPFYEQTQPQKEEVKRRLEEKYNDQIIVRCAYGIDPFPENKNQSPHHIAMELVKSGCDAIAVAEHFHVISDSMSKYHCRQHVLEGIRPIDIRLPVVFANQIGGHPELDKGVVLKVKDELESIKPGTDVAFFLSNHGFPVNKVGKYDAKSDCYHENVRIAFQSTKEAIMKTVDWSGRIEVIQVFGQFLEEKYNPDGINTRPLDALKSVADRGFQSVIDIPYEFPGDSVDALIKLRQAYGIDPPTWDKNFETLFEREGIPVKICSALFHQEYRINAYFNRACEAVEQCFEKLSH
ncbi:MAG: Ferrochelatase [Candidatus Lokiarchaeum sp. GC14_75]|nr:MAG: Ferrochelatase [Candidatus Lokiarchaeum sp. GC14_75]